LVTWLETWQVGSGALGKRYSRFYLSKETSNGVQDQLEQQRHTSTVNSSLESRLMTNQAQFHHSLPGGKVTVERDGTQEAGVNLMSNSYLPTPVVHSTLTLYGRIKE